MSSPRTTLSLPSPCHHQVGLGDKSGVTMGGDRMHVYPVIALMRQMERRRTYWRTSCLIDRTVELPTSISPRKTLEMSNNI